MTGWERATAEALKSLPAERAAADGIAQKIKMAQAELDCVETDPVLSEQIEWMKVKLIDKTRRIDALEDALCNRMSTDERRVIQELVIDRRGRSAARTVYELGLELHISEAGIYRIRKSALKKAAAALEIREDTG